MRKFKLVIAVAVSMVMVLTAGCGFAYGETSNDGDRSVMSTDGVKIVQTDSAVEASKAVPAADNDIFYDVNLNTGAVTVGADGAGKADKEKVAGGFQRIYGMKYRESGLKGKSGSEKTEQITEMTAESELYSLDRVEGDTATVVADFGSCRLIVDEQEAIDTFGAETGTYFKDTYFLRYPDEEMTAEAYSSLCAEYGSDHVFKDRPAKAAANNWSYKYMQFDTRKSQIETYGDKVLVAVLDTGINPYHDEFEERTILKGWNFVKKNGDTWDDHGHGTAVTSVITQSTGNNVQILPVKVLNYEAWGWNSDFLLGIAYAAEQGADVVNMSITGYLEENPQDFIDLADKYFKLLQGPVVVAAGNNCRNIDKKYAWPAISKQTITISALRYNNGDPTFADDYSNYGASIDFAAPGTYVRLADTWTYDYYYDDWGTSFASPHIAAAAAQIMSNDPSITKKSQVYDKLKSLSKDLGSTGKDKYYGYGCPMMNGLTVIKGKLLKSLRQAEVIGVATKVYTGSDLEQDPDKISVYLDETYLQNGSDYTISYKNNRNVGMAKMVITGTGSYSKVKEVPFRILPKGTSLGKLKKGKKSIIVKWKKQKARMAKERIDGYQIQVATNKSFTKNVKSKRVKGYKKTKVKMTKLKKNRTYYVRVRTFLYPNNDIMNKYDPKKHGRAFYSKWSKAKRIKTK